jgi:undecaprenyl-diphosphatase
MNTLFHYIFQLDTALFLLGNHTIANPIFDSFFLSITDGKFWIVPGIFLLLAYIQKHRLSALGVVGLIIITFALTDPISVRIFKPLFHRMRPCNPNALVEGGRFLLGFKHSLSFPSAHATNAFGMATMLFLFHRKHAYWFFLIASLVAFSRVYVGVHYPLDILGGAILGSLTALGVFALFKTIANKFHTK